MSLEEEQWLTTHSTERNLDLASTQNRIAEEKARELKSTSSPASQTELH
jgi:hypothetical protein